jgi:hypothetical protein
MSVESAVGTPASGDLEAAALPSAFQNGKSLGVYKH